MFDPDNEVESCPFYRRKLPFFLVVNLKRCFFFTYWYSSTFLWMTNDKWPTLLIPVGNYIIIIILSEDTAESVVIFSKLISCSRAYLNVQLDCLQTLCCDCAWFCWSKYQTELKKHSWTCWYWQASNISRNDLSAVALFVPPCTQMVVNSWKKIFRCSINCIQGYVLQFIKNVMLKDSV